MRLPAADPSDEGMHLTPLIDVVFLLLIFFLVATRFDEEERILTLPLPDVLKAQPLTSGPTEVVVNITRNGEYIINDRSYNEAGLRRLLHDAAVKNPGMQMVQIRAHREVQFQYPLKVVGICKNEKITYYCTVIEQRT
jgi:biopolymer transport protein ExbD